MQRVLFRRLQLRRLPTGRASYALHKMNEVVESGDIPAPIVESIEVAEARAQETRDLELLWMESRNVNTAARGKAVYLDTKIDQTIAGIARILEGEAVGDEGDPEVIAAKTLLARIFPEGVSAIVHLEFEEQLDLVLAIIARLRGNLAGEVRLLGLERHVARLETLTSQFRAELGRRASRPVDFETVRASRNALHEAMCEVVVAVLFNLRERTSTNDELITALLAPIVEQENAIAEAFRRKRRPLDVDPHSGVELEPVTDIFEEEPIEYEPIEA
ncbi:MAG: hypothetical protein ACNA8W_25245 [Bradymonadaceae bacterium]